MRRDFTSAQRGFGLVAALFLILVIAGVIAAMARLSVTQHSTSSLAIQQARAYQAARAGLEWGIAAAPAGICMATPAEFSLDGFRVKVEEACPSNSPERVLTAEAWFSEADSPDYVFRRVQVTFEE